jgi:exopolyphosphatase/guanosine-5'-triphosphate,3'-diphosphate pyrophosphatase
MTVRVAAIDCGTNSIRLLIADVDPESGRVLDIDRRMEIVRLGQGMDSTGEFAVDALERTFAACDSYASVIASHNVDRVRFVATSASRDARNRDVFIAGVKSRLGVEPDVISGDEEARLSFAGATNGLVGAAAPYLVVDIGGGSTEFVLGVTSPQAARSVNIGCVRMTERHFRNDPPSQSEIDAAIADIDAAIGLAGETVSLGEAKTLVGLAGSVTTVAAIALELTEYDPTRIHGARLSAETIDAVSDRLLGLSRDERAQIHVMHPGRVDVINAGALVLRRIVRLTGLPDVLVSEHDILDGIALALAAN